MCPLAPGSMYYEENELLLIKKYKALFFMRSLLFFVLALGRRFSLGFFTKNSRLYLVFFSIDYISFNTKALNFPISILEFNHLVFNLLF